MERILRGRNYLLDDGNKCLVFLFLAMNFFFFPYSPPWKNSSTLEKFFHSLTSALLVVPETIISTTWRVVILWSGSKTYSGGFLLSPEWNLNIYQNLKISTLPPTLLVQSQVSRCMSAPSPNYTNLWTVFATDSVPRYLNSSQGFFANPSPTSPSMQLKPYLLPGGNGYCHPFL